MEIPGWLTETQVEKAINGLEKEQADNKISTNGPGTFI